MDWNKFANLLFMVIARFIMTNSIFTNLYKLFLTKLFSTTPINVYTFVRQEKKTWKIWKCKIKCITPFGEQALPIIPKGRKIYETTTAIIPIAIIIVNMILKNKLLDFFVV